MKKMPVWVIAVLMLSSCGPTAEELAVIQKHRDDSIKVATEAATRAQLEVEHRIAEEKRYAMEQEKAKRSELKQQIRILKNKIDDAKGQLAGLYVRLENDKKFHIGRTAKQKEEWIANDNRDIAKMQRFIQEATDKVAEMEQSLQ